MAETPEERSIEVLAAVIQREGRWLVGRRPAGKRHEGLWEFPGGKVLDGESQDAALARELREELDLEVASVGRALLRVHDTGSAYVITFVEVTAHGDPKPIEHTALAWCAGKDLRELSLAPAGRRFVRDGLPPLGDE